MADNTIILLSEGSQDFFYSSITYITWNYVEMWNINLLKSADFEPLSLRKNEMACHEASNSGINNIFNLLFF